MTRSHPPFRIRRAGRGFTLLEVLLALGMIILLFATMTRVFDDLVDARTRVRRSMFQTEGIAAAFELLTRSADAAVATGLDGEAGVTGDSVSIRIARSGVATTRLGDSSTGISPVQDRHAVELAFRNGEIVVRDEDDGGTETLVSGLFAVRFRYHDGLEWSDSWSSAASGLPVAIECSIWTSPWPDAAWPAWIPEPELDDEASSDDGEAALGIDFEESFEEFEIGTILESDDPLPVPDHVRVISILDAVPVERLGMAGEDAS
jgi:type II secretory pathway component PulJ